MTILAWQIPAFYFSLHPDEKPHFVADPVCTAQIPSAIQWRGIEGAWSFLCREYGGMPYLLKPLSEVFALWPDQPQAQRPLPELSFARTSPIDLALPEGKDSLLFSTPHRSS